jgi:hypothetical protein
MRGEGEGTYCRYISVKRSVATVINQKPALVGIGTFEPSTRVNSRGIGIRTGCHSINASGSARAPPKPHRSQGTMKSCNTPPSMHSSPLGRFARSFDRESRFCSDPTSSFASLMDVLRWVSREARRE